MWGYLVGGILIYFLFKKNVKKIKAWIDRHRKLIEKWKDVPEIADAYAVLRAAFEAARLDRKWTPTEIITVLTLAVKLFNLVKKYEEEEE